MGILGLPDFWMELLLFGMGIFLFTGQICFCCKYFVKFSMMDTGSFSLISKIMFVSGQESVLPVHLKIFCT